MNLLICYYNVDKLKLKEQDLLLEKMEKTLEEKVKDSEDTEVLVIPVRGQETKIDTVYIPVSIDKLI